MEENLNVKNTENTSNNEKIKEKKFNFDYKILITIILFLCSLIFLILPAFEIVLTSGEDNVLINLYNLVFGVGINDFNLNLDVFALLSFIFVILGLISYLISIFIKDNKKNIPLLISSLSILIGIIFYVVISYGIYLFNPSISSYPEFDSLIISEASFISYLIIQAIILVLVTSSLKLKKVLFTTREIAEISMMVALAVVLDKIKIQVGISGGSINASALPLMILSIRIGFIKGVFASSILFGVITNIIDGWGIQTLPFDYMIGFFGYAFPGLFYYIFSKTCFKNKELASLMTSFAIGSVCAFIVRMFGSGLSSYLIYNVHDIIEILVYNYIYVGVSALTCLALSLMLSPAIKRINHLFPLKRDYMTI